MTGDEFTLGHLAGRLGALEERTARIEGKVDAVLAEATRAKGGVAVIAWVGGAGAALCAAIIEFIARSR